MRFIAMLLVPISLGSHAALDTWEAFDFDGCKHWLVTNDTAHDRNPDSVVPGISDKYEGWYVMEAALLSANAKPQFGLCRDIYAKNDKWAPTTITCFKGRDFPMAGATYKLITPPNVLPSYACTRGCSRTTIKKFHDMGYERNSRNQQHTVELARFKKTCRK